MTCVQPGGVGEGENTDGRQCHRQQRDLGPAWQRPQGASAPGDDCAQRRWGEQPEPGRGGAGDDVSGEVGDQ